MAPEGRAALSSSAFDQVAGRVVHVDGARRRRQRRQPVVIVLRMEPLHVQHRHPVLPHLEDMLLPAGAVLVGHRPAVASRHHLHPVRAQHVKLARPARGDLARRLQIPVAAQQQVPVEPLQQRRPALPRIGRGEKVDHRMHVEPPVGVLHHHRHRRRRLGDQLHAAERHRIAEEPHPRQRRGVARRPRHPPRAMKGHDRRRGRGLHLRRLRAGHAEKLQYHERSLPELRLGGRPCGPMDPRTRRRAAPGPRGGRAGAGRALPGPRARMVRQKLRGAARSAPACGSARSSAR